MMIDELPVRVIRSRRTTSAIGVDRDGRVIFRAPYGITDAEIRRMLETHRAWILKKVNAAKKTAASPVRKLAPCEVEALAKQAARVLPAKTAAYAWKMNLTYGRITIRCQKTRWGSCSSEGNLNYNCLLMLCPDEVQDYVVVHELCHRLEMSHSPRFWALVASVLPDYRRHVRWLKENGGALLRRVYG